MFLSNFEFDLIIAMPTLDAIALDRFIESGTSNSVEKSGLMSKPPLPNAKALLASKLERRNSSPVADRKVSRPQIKPSLYATPEPTPLPDSPTSYTPSPYIVNHKRRGPRLKKSLSDVDVSSRQKALDEENVNGNAKHADSSKPNGGSATFDNSGPVDVERENGVRESQNKEEVANGSLAGSVHYVNGSAHDGESTSTEEKVRCNGMSNGFTPENDAVKLVPLNLKRSYDCEDFLDPRESMSAASTNEGEDYSGTESSARLTAQNMEFYDAWEELSTESGQLPSSLRDPEAELREMRLSLLMELEKRKQTEESLNNMQSKWDRIRQQLALVGVTLPVNPINVTEDELPDPADEISRQVDIARLVSDSVGRGITRAEMEIEMESQIESKNFEIARLVDRLNYYEAVNREMFQRNQEAIELARRDRQRKKKMQKWIWGSVATAITLGSAALAWSYLPAPGAKGSAPPNHFPAARDSDDSAK